MQYRRRRHLNAQHSRCLMHLKAIRDLGEAGYRIRRIPLGVSSASGRKQNCRESDEANSTGNTTSLQIHLDHS
jgi:hypothetical protein